MDRHLLRRILLLWLILLWPLAVFKGPADFPDTTSYYKGGAVAVSIVLERLGLSSTGRSATPAIASPGRSAAAPSHVDKTRLVKDVKGVRSISYSVFSYVFSGPGAAFIPLAMMQALFIAICLAVTFNAAMPPEQRYFRDATLVLAFASTLAPYVCYVMPDIFAGITILLLALLGAAANRLSRALLPPLIAIAAFAITTHPSHILLAAAMVIMIAALMLTRAVRGDRTALVTLGRAAAVVAVAVAAVVASGLIGFGEASIAPHRYPFALARSLEVPQARAHLIAMCKSQPLEVCKLYAGRTLPTSSYDFLWGEQGVENVANAAQMRALRDQEPAIIWDMARTAPLGIASVLITDLARQLATFNLDGLGFGHTTRQVSPLTIEFIADRRPWTFPLKLLQVLTVGGVLLSLAAFAFWLRRRNRNAVLAAMLIGGVLANAAICSMLSAVASRYQARVIWLIPLAALLLWAGRREVRQGLPSD